MFTRFLKVFILTAVFAIVGSFSSFSASGSFPFEIEFDTEEIDRLCYAGHRGGAVEYAEGIAILPETSFSVELKEGDNLGADISKLSAEIAVIYENSSNDGAYREIVKTYREGSFKESEKYKILSDNLMANLDERDKLYSDQFKGMTLTFTSSGRTSRQMTIYLYVCSDEEFYSYLEEFYG